MKRIQTSVGLRLLTATFLMAGLVLQVIPSETAHAAQITDRSLELQANGSNGGSQPNVAANHLYTFTIPATATLGSIKFEYCTTASGTCIAPAGLETNDSTTPATLGASSGVATFTTLTNVSANESYISRTAASASAGSLTVRLDSVINPTATNYTFFARISTYASEDTTGSAIDTGTVTASTATQIVLDGTMPESLVFCTGETIGLTGGVPDCATATDGVISFNQLFSPTDTATATSQMAASTNAGFGYVVTVNGPTLTSGSNTISALASPTASVKGVSQFGMNLVSNTIAASNPAIGTAVAPANNATNYKGVAQTGYNAADTFSFVTGADVAASNDGGAGGTDAQIFTASYIVNVPGSQPAGTYTTTLTYIATPTF